MKGQTALWREKASLWATSVVAVEVADTPGVLTPCCSLFRNGINVEYDVSAFAQQRPGKRVMIFASIKVDHAVDVLRDNGFSHHSGGSASASISNRRFRNF